MPPKSYFGYVEREADSYVNWADVGRTITNTVDEIDRVRTEKKAAIDAAYKEELQRINDKPIGQKDDVNKWTIDMAYNAAENLKIQHNLLKSGKLPVKDYAIYLQNTSDSIKNLYGTVEKIQTAFKERLDRQANGENQEIEMWDGTDLEQYGKLTDLGANFNINGNLTFSRLETVTEDGKTITRAKPGSENLLSVNQLAGAVSSKYNKYDYLTDADNFIKRLGDNLMSYRVLGSEDRAGSITQIVDKTGELDEAKAAALGITDATELARLKGVVSEYSKAEEAYIKAALDPKYHKSSILTEALGYKVTDNAEEAKKDLKLMLVQRETDGTITPILNETQEKEAREFLRGQYRQMIDKKLQIDTYTEVGAQKQQPQIYPEHYFRRGEEKTTVESMSSWVGEMWGGDNAAKQRALVTVKSIPGVADAKYVSRDGAIYLTVLRESDGKKGEIQMTNKDGTPFSNVETFGEAAAGWIYTDKEDRSLLNKNLTAFRKSLVPYKNFQNFGKDRPADLWGELAAPKPKAEPITLTEQQQAGILSAGSSSAANNLNQILKSRGLKAVANEETWGNFVQIYKISDTENKEPLITANKGYGVQTKWGKDSKGYSENLLTLQTFLENYKGGNEAP
jgi:hypothetical protein